MGEYSKGKSTRTVRLRYTNRGAKECQQAFLAPLPGISNTNPRAIYLVFGLTLIFIIAYTLVFLFVSLKAGGKKLDTKFGLREVHNPLRQISTIGKR